MIVRYVASRRGESYTIIDRWENDTVVAVFRSEALRDERLSQLAEAKEVPDQDPTNGDDILSGAYGDGWGMDGGIFAWPLRKLRNR